MNKSQKSNINFKKASFFSDCFDILLGRLWGEMFNVHIRNLKVDLSKTETLRCFTYILYGSTAPVGQGPLIAEAWRSHSDTHRTR
jgi:hypothetical protein